jgi:hypothetical protein
MKFSFQGIFDQDSNMQIQSIESLIMIIASLVVNAVLDWKVILGNSNKMIPVVSKILDDLNSLPTLSAKNNRVLVEKLQKSINHPKNFLIFF